jgi:hypothetical protein
VKSVTTKPVRCAIYTRVSTGHGLRDNRLALERPKVLWLAG